jgi:hypothetical protein
VVGGRLGTLVFSRQGWIRAVQLREARVGRDRARLLGASSDGRSGGRSITALPLHALTRMVRLRSWTRTSVDRSALHRTSHSRHPTGLGNHIVSTTRLVPRRAPYRHIQRDRAGANITSRLVVSGASCGHICMHHIALCWSISSTKPHHTTPHHSLHQHTSPAA